LRDNDIASRKIDIEKQRLILDLQKEVARLRQTKDMTEMKTKADLVKNIVRRRPGGGKQ